MPSVYVFEDANVDRLHPLTYSRATFELRIGGLTLLDRLRHNLGYTIEGVFTRPTLAHVVQRRVSLPVNAPVHTKGGILLVNGRWLLLGDWRKGNLGAGGMPIPPVDSVGIHQTTIVWMHLSEKLAATVDFAALQDAQTLESLLSKLQRKSVPATIISRPWDLLDHQRAAIEEDFERLLSNSGGTGGVAGSGMEEGSGKTPHGGSLIPGAHVINPERVYIASGAKIWPGAVLDAQNGPIVIEHGTEVRANAVITGPVWIGPHCVIRSGADIREGCSLGPYTRVGGELSNTVFLGYASKQHLGFLGQTIVGEWVNMGAGTTTSNLKNTYGNVKMRLQRTEESSGRTFLGSVIADHAKLGIGTYLSTGSVVGFASHVVVARPPLFVPSFAWLVDEEKGICRADFEKIEQIAAIAMKRREVEFTPEDHDLFVRIASDCVAAEDFGWPSEK